MMSQTRCELWLFSCAGKTYAVPDDDEGNTPLALALWANRAGARRLPGVVPAGTVVTEYEVQPGTLVECELSGMRVMVPRDVLLQQAN